MPARRFALLSFLHLFAPRFVRLFALVLANLFVWPPCEQVRAQPVQDPPSANNQGPTAGAPIHYEGIVREAIAAQAAGDFEGAHGLFERAHALKPNARTLRGMGVASFQGKHFARALRELDAALVHPEKPLDAELRRAVEDLRARASTEVGVWILRVEPAEARISIDGGEPTSSEQPLLLDPGVHQLTLTADGYIEQSVEISVMPGTRGPMGVRLAPIGSEEQASGAAALTQLPAPVPAPAPSVPNKLPHRRRLLASWTLLGLSGAAGVASGVLALVGTYNIGNIADACRKKPGNKCSPAQDAEYRKDANIRTIERSINACLGFAGATLGAAGAVLTWDYFANGRKLDLRVSANSISLHGQF